MARRLCLKEIEVCVLFLRLRKTQNALPLTVFFFFLFFCQPCPEYRNQPYPDFGHCYDMNSRVCCEFLIPSENGFGHFKEQRKRQARFVLRKTLFVILCTAVRKLNKLINFNVINN